LDADGDQTPAASVASKGAAQSDRAQQRSYGAAVILSQPWRPASQAVQQRRQRT